MRSLMLGILRVVLFPFAAVSIPTFADKFNGAVREIKRLDDHHATHTMH